MMKTFFNGKNTKISFLLLFKFYIRNCIDEGIKFYLIHCWKFPLTNYNEQYLLHMHDAP